MEYYLNSGLNYYWGAGTIFADAENPSGDLQLGLVLELRGCRRSLSFRVSATHRTAHHAFEP